MTPERRRKIEELYHAALERDPADRAAFLNEVAPDDADLRTLVDELVIRNSSPDALLHARASTSSETKTTTGLSPGAQLGPYRIEAPLGAGGMGRVYKAVDTRLNRTVAIKVSLEEFSDRFQREARAIAALNHRFICTLYDVGPDYLVMEHVEGRPLKGPLPANKVLEFGQQICDALDVAHRKGIVHRDLKPSNILLTRSGVKVLDFGLAKMTGQETLTRAGAVMGTPAYMAPEQWQGNEADPRSDIYALGLVLYEMATGEVTLKQTLEPPELDHVVKTCVATDPEERWQSAREVKLALELVRQPALVQRADHEAGSRSAWRHSLRSLAPWCVTAAAVILAVGVLVRSRPATVPEVLKIRTTIQIPPDQQLVAGGTPVPFDISPDGEKLVYLAVQAGRRKLFLRPLDEFNVTPLPGTEDASSPFFSPDGRWIGFFIRRRLFKVATDGSSPVLIAEVADAGDGACWVDDDTIIYGSASGLMRIPGGGGKSEQLSTLRAGEARHILPRFVRGTPTVLFTTITTTGYRRHVAAVSLNHGTHKVLIEGQQAAYLPDGRLVYATDDVLRAVPFDLLGLRLSGSPSTLLDDVYTSQGGSQTYFRVTSSGLLLYVPGRNEHSLVRVDRAGHSAPLTPRRAGYRMPRVSNDGRFVAVIIDPPDEANSHVWILDLQHGSFSKLTREGHNLPAIYTPDGNRMAWADWTEGPRVYWQAADGSGRRERLSLLEPSIPQDFSSDGKYLVLTVGRPDTVLWALPLQPDKKPFPLIETPYRTGAARVSPDGRWLAYVSDETGRDEVFVRRFPVSERKWIVSTEGGTSPVWSRDGKEIFYLEGRRMMAATVQASMKISIGKAVFLFDRPELTMAFPAYDVLREGFVMVERDPLSMLTEFRVVQNRP